MTDWTLTSLDSRAHQFCGGRLRSHGSLGQLLAAECSADTFDAFAYVPPNFPEIRLYDFSRGVSRSRRSDGELQDQDTVRDSLASEVLSKLVWHLQFWEAPCFVTELVSSSAGDAWVGKSSLPLSTYAGHDVYMHTIAPTSEADVSRLIKAGWHHPGTYGVVSGWLGKSARLPSRLRRPQIDRLASLTNFFYVGAYDLESFVIFVRQGLELS